MPDVSLADFARMYEVSPPRIQELIALGFPASPALGRGKRRTVNTRSAIDWLVARETRKAATPDEGETLKEADLRKARADADLAEVRAAQAANQVIALAEVESMVERVMVLVASQLDGIAGRIAAPVAALTDAAACRQVIFDECRRIRGAMAAEFQAVAAVAQGGGVDQAAPAEDAGSVGGPVQDPAEG